MVWNRGTKGERSLEVAFVEGCFYKLFILNLCAWAVCVLQLASLHGWPLKGTLVALTH